MRPRHPDPDYASPIPSEEDFMSLGNIPEVEDDDLEADPDFKDAATDSPPEEGEDQDPAEVDYP